MAFFNSKAPKLVSGRATPVARMNWSEAWKLPSIKYREARKLESA
jgi:hypothetical protein